MGPWVMRSSSGHNQSKPAQLTGFKSNTIALIEGVKEIRSSPPWGRRHGLMAVSPSCFGPPPMRYPASGISFGSWQGPCHHV